MDLVTDDGYIISVPIGCKKELGRGLGLATHDRTVSRHQVLLELQEPEAVYHDVSQIRLNVRVLGPNPVSIIHCGREGAFGNSKQGLCLLKRGEEDMLSVGDKISLSISVPLFFTVKGGGYMEEEDSLKFMERSGSTSGVSALEDALPRVNPRISPAENDLVAQWNARKDSQTQQVDKEGSYGQKKCVSLDDKAAKEEEDGIADAVARREKRAYERRLQQLDQEQQQQQQQPPQKRLGAFAERSSVPNLTKLIDEEEGEEDQPLLTYEIDPVKEFGFLVEGREFEQYKKRHRQWGGQWSWHENDVEDERDVDEPYTLHTRKKSKKIRAENDDDDDYEWVGENPEEKETVDRSKKSKSVRNRCLRSYDTSSSKKAIAKATTQHISGKADSDNDDETLGGFIVDDDQRDEDRLGDEEDEEDYDENDEDSDSEDSDEDENEGHADEDDDIESIEEKEEPRRNEKPICKYGKNCYRKNKQHLEEYRH